MLVSNTRDRYVDDEALTILLVRILPRDGAM